MGWPLTTEKNGFDHLTDREANGVKTARGLNSALLPLVLTYAKDAMHHPRSEEKSVAYRFWIGSAGVMGRLFGAVVVSHFWDFIPAPRACPEPQEIVTMRQS